MGNESDGTLPLRADQLRGGGRPGDGQGLSLHRLPEADRHGVSRRHREPAGEIRAEERDAEDLLKTAESGSKRAHAFCPECGTPIYSAAPGNPPSYSLRVGTLDRRAELLPARQIWCRSALPWSLDLQGVERFERQGS